MNTSAAAFPGAPRSVSPGLWRLAWRQLCRDRVGLVSLAVVLCFLALMAASGFGLIAADWSKEVGVSYAPPSFMGPDAAGTSKASSPAPDSSPMSPIEEIGIADPLAETLAEVRQLEQLLDGGGLRSPVCEAHDALVPRGPSGQRSRGGRRACV